MLENEVCMHNVNGICSHSSIGGVRPQEIQELERQNWIQRIQLVLVTVTAISEKVAIKTHKEEVL